MADNNAPAPIDVTVPVWKGFITNASRRLANLLNVTHQGKRNYYQIYGYPEHLGDDDGFRLMWQAARRQGIANRITAGVSKTCWRDGFELRTDPDDEKTVVLKDELAGLVKQGLCKKLEAADTLNRIGRFSLLLVGVPDGTPNLEAPLGKATRKGALDQVYFRAYGYDQVTVASWVTDKNDPRYGLPECYTVDVSLQRNDSSSKSPRRSAVTVHHSRLVHLNEHALDDDVEGMGTLEPVFNRIMDLDKATGGSAEAYFRNARGKVGYEIDKDFAAEFLKDETMQARFQEGVEKFTNEWQDFTVASGAKINSLDTPHDSPADTIKGALWEIAGYTGIPIRVLTGEGAGQLAGSEDQLALNQIIADRQRGVCAPFVQGVLEILAAAGMLELDDDACVHFPPQQAATEKEQAEIDNKKADTLGKIATAASSIAGAGLDVRSALDECGLDNVNFEELDDDDDLDREVEETGIDPELDDDPNEPDPAQEE